MKIDIGIAGNKNQPFDWWSALIPELLRIQYEGKIEIAQFLAVGSALTDHNRNAVTAAFLEGDSEAIFWIDDDTVHPPETLERLLGLDTDVAAGVYFRRGLPYDPLAYKRLPNRMYTPMKYFERGEIVPVESVGMGCTLVRRHVYEKIREQYRLFRRLENATVVAVHGDDVVAMDGGLPAVVHDWAGKAVIGPGGRGYLVDALVPAVEPLECDWPFYVLEWGRTEDHFFCEMALRCGFEILVDTWLDCKHLGIQPVTWRHFWQVRDTYRAQVALQGMLGE